ncbi:MAG: hypothetical protein DME01_00475 [Candidatus Rokuibacteriota bacterium]|nr:MAG: hypothetical protein DME01_00475 [Candidatus Rokubacteria bacterium]
MLLMRVANGVAVGVLALVLTLDASVQEFAELVSLSDEARRERLNLPSACAPIVSAVKPAGSNSSRLTVFVECSAETTATSSPIEPASFRDK